MTDKSTKRRNAVIAGVAGAALLFGGSTYALWSASAGVDGGTITAGDLRLVGGTSSVWDVSTGQDGTTYRTDQTENAIKVVMNTVGEEEGGTALDGAPYAHAIDKSTWRMVPGDEVAIALPYKVTLEGDNLVAVLELPTRAGLVEAYQAAQGENPASGTTFTTKDDAYKHLTFTYDLYNGTAKVNSERVPLEAGDSGKLKSPVSYFQAAQDGQDLGEADGLIPVITADNDNTTTVTVLLYVKFDSSAADREDAEKVLALQGQVVATLTQVRCDSPEEDGHYPEACGA